ncbi:peptidase [Halobacillus fulvus]|nr:peptidase [Halobacillus fulvus]
MIELQVLKQRSRKAMGAVHEEVGEMAMRLIEQAYELGIFVQISSGYRSLSEQARLYGQGRPNYYWRGKKYGAPGNIVTKAKPGQSVHNSGRAIDFFLVSPDGRTALWQVDEKWRKVAAIGKRLGFRWGGDWKSFPDYPHLEWNGRKRSAVVRRGDSGSRVKDVQQRLIRMGYSLGRYGADGRFGPITESAVRQFQEDHAIEIDGIVGPETWQFLG